MLLMLLLFMAVCLLALMFVFKHGILGFIAAGFWFLSGAQAYTSSTLPVAGVWDVYYALFFLCMGMTLACVFMPLITRPKKAEEAGDVVLSDMEQQEKSNDELWSATQIPRMGRRGYVSRKRSR